MEVQTTAEAKENILAFTKRLVGLLMDKKGIDNDIKALKAEFKEEGVPTGIVSACINKIKAQMKKTDTELFEEDTIKEWLESDKVTADNIGQLID